MVSLPFSLFSYSAYLEFFQDAYEYARQKDETVSYESIAAACGFKSRTQARSLIKGVLPPNKHHLRALAQYFRLNENETQYLECLVEFEQSKLGPAAYALFNQLVTLQKNRVPAANPFKDIEVATSVLHMSVLSALDLPGAPQEPASIRSLLKDRYSETEIKSALSDLSALGFIQNSNGVWKVLHKHMNKIDLNPNFFLRRFHQQCLEVAQVSLENEDPSQRYLVGANFSINEKVFPRIVQKLNAFLENLMRMEGVAGPSDTVVQLSAQFIKMSVRLGEKKESGLGGETAERAFPNEENTVIRRG